MISKTITAALESLIYEGIKEWKRSCPAVSQSCILKLLFSTLTVFDTKSTPTVGYTRERDTCSLPVKLSKMNRLMMEVLPTD